MDKNSLEPHPIDLMLDMHVRMRFTKWLLEKALYVSSFSIEAPCIQFCHRSIFYLVYVVYNIKPIDEKYCKFMKSFFFFKT